MKKVNQVVTTIRTGEVVDKTFSKKTKNRPGFLMVYRGMFEVTSTLMKANDYYSISVYLSILGQMTVDSNIVKTSTMELSLQANYAQRNIGRTLDVLQAIGAIIHSKISKTHFIQIIVNPGHTFKGSGVMSEVAQDIWNEQRKNFLQKKEIYIKD